MNLSAQKISLRIKALFLLLIILFNAVFMFAGGIKAYADADNWPYPGGDIQAEGAVVMDADTLAVLWGRNQDVQYCPASITKIMTALVVLENCSLTDKVPITANAVYGLESGATTAGLSVDDILTVEDLLYALLLRSANDAANALAIYTAGSISDFAVMMNEKAKELGCKNTDFKNPSGLTDSEHLTTAYDMALILAACIKNPVFLEIESADRYKLSPTQKYPSGLTVTMGHKMLRAGTDYSDDRVIAGKTGYTSTSGNTLVTAIEQDGRRVIVVCMKDRNPYHYTDTSTLMEFGINSFENISISDPVDRFSCASRLAADKICSADGSNIVTDTDMLITVPKGYDESAVTASYDYNLSSDAPDMAVALLKLVYSGRTVGSAYLLNDIESLLVFDDLSETTKKVAGATIVLIAAGVFLFTAGTGSRVYAVKKENERKRRFREKQNRRLRAMGISRSEFESIVVSRKAAGVESIDRDISDVYTDEHKKVRPDRPESRDLSKAYRKTQPAENAASHRSRRRKMLER